MSFNTLHWNTEWCPYYRGVFNSEVTPYTTVLHWDTELCPYYRGVFNSEVTQYTTVLYWDTELCPYYRGVLNSQVQKNNKVRYTMTTTAGNIPPSFTRVTWRHNRTHSSWYMVAAQHHVSEQRGGDPGGYWTVPGTKVK